MTTIKIITNRLLREEYEKLASHPLQSWLWGEARQKIGNHVLRVGQFKTEKLVKVFQITLHSIPYTPYQVGYVGRSGLPTKDLLNFLIAYGQKKKVIFFKFEPYVFRESGQAKLISHPRWHLSRQSIFPDWTIIINLKKTADQLFRELKPKTRYNIKLAIKRGVSASTDNTDVGFNQFSQLYFDTCRRQKYFGHNRHYHRTVFNTLRDKIANILIASYQKEPLAAYELFLYKKRLYYPYGGTSLKFRNFMASNLLMWEAIKFGLKNKADFFDLWGSLPPSHSAHHPWSGFTRFKEGYGGEFKQFVGSYDLVCLPLLYPAYQVTYYLRGQYLKYIAPIFMQKDPPLSSDK